MLISDRRLADPRGLAHAALAAAELAPVSVQLREKDLDVRDLLGLASQFRRELEAATVPAGRVVFLVNGRFDVALAARADGVHLPAGGPPVARVRQAVGESLVLGISTHSAAEVREARIAGADYVVYGPIHDTPSKRGMGSPQGLERLQEACHVAESMPVLALGGIGPSGIRECRENGAHGVGVIRAVLDAKDPAATARRFQEVLRGERA